MEIMLVYMCFMLVEEEMQYWEEKTVKKGVGDTVREVLVVVGVVIQKEEELLYCSVL